MCEVREYYARSVNTMQEQTRSESVAYPPWTGGKYAGLSTDTLVFAVHIYNIQNVYKPC